MIANKNSVHIMSFSVYTPDSIIGSKALSLNAK